VAVAIELDRIGAVDDARVEWERLAAASGNPFATLEWTETWLEHAAGPYAPQLFLARDAAGRVAAIVPLVIARGRHVRKARFLGFRAANEVGPICAPEDAELGAEALRNALAATRRDWDVFVGEHLPGAGWGPKLGATVMGSKGSPIVRGPWTTWDEYLASRTHNLRSELRRKERRLEEQGMTHGTAHTREQLEPALDALFELHRGRWGSRASPFFSGLEPFHRAFACAAFERGWVRLRVLRLDERPVAANYSLRFGDAEWSYQLGRDLRLEHASVGLIGTAIAVREAFAEGVTAFRLGPGEQPYKFRLANEGATLETVGIAHGLRGRASLLAARRREGSG
jgi:CelD/BcsL family acetyltransferase involved in cellulose biosynthesis